MTFASQEMPWMEDPRKKMLRWLHSEVSRAIAQEFKLLDEENASVARNHQAGHEVLYSWHQSEATVITFNWDTLVERLAMQLPNNVREGSLYQVSIRDVAHRLGDNQNVTIREQPATSFQLLKMHGSINWYQAATGNSPDIYYNPVDPGVLTPFPDDAREKGMRGLIPMIIPPVLDKSVFYGNDVITAQWTLAMDALKKASAIYISGYSLPETDLATQFLFREALEENRQCPIYLVTKAASKEEEILKQRYLDVLNDKSNEQGRLNIHNAGADESSLGLLAKLINKKGP